MKDISDKLTVLFDKGLKDDPALCVSRICGEKTVVLKMELREQADILYRLLTEQMTKAEIKGIPQPRWIPVSERLPEAGEYIGDVPRYYLVQNEYGDMLIARYTHSEYWEDKCRLKPVGDEIVAWMPLPEPYKSESEDKE